MRVDSAERLIAATGGHIYRALTDRDMVERWLPPEGARGIVEIFEPRPGGAFRMTLVFETPDVGKSSSTTDIVNGEFVELAPDRLVRQRFRFVSDNPAFAGSMVMTWTLAPAADGTLVTVSARDVPAGISRQDHEAAMASSLANLARCVE